MPIEQPDKIWAKANFLGVREKMLPTWTRSYFLEESENWLEMR